MTQNAAITYMSCIRDLPILHRSIALLHKNFKYAREYPIVVFHDDLNQVAKSSLMVSLHRELGMMPRITFEELKWEIPSWVSTDPSRYSTSLNEFWMGYRHMCRFYSGGMYRHPSLAQYDWYWRLDSDSYILSPVEYDPFQRMADSGYEYAYMSDIDDKDHARVCRGLWEATMEFMQKNDLPMTNQLKEHSCDDGKSWDYAMFYTNFEIGKMSFFRGEKYMAYFDHLDQTGEIYYNRWGDNVIHWLGVNMLMDESKIWAVKDMTYQHNNWIKNLSALKDGTVPNDILNLIDGDTNPKGRKARLLYAIDRYRRTGIDGCNWHD
jgi:alpha 1,2-mannosyltransferase